MELKRNRVGRSSLQISNLGLGGTGLGNLYQAVEDRAALDLVSSVHAAGINFYDTAPCYGVGLSEQRLGRALPTLDRSEIAVSTKVGYSLVPLVPGEEHPTLFADTPRFRTDYDFSYDGAMRSIEDSLKRLNLDRVNMVAIHDPDETVGADPNADPYARSRFREAMDGAYKALDELRDQRVIDAIGVGMNQWQMLVDFARAGDFDYFLLAGRYTLLRYDAAETLMPLCAEKGISVIVGGPYCSGILATGAVEGAYFEYAPATDEVLAKVRRIEGVCAAFGISLRAAALQFPLAHPAVASVIPGSRSAEELNQNLVALKEHLPASFWEALSAEQLLDQHALGRSIA